MDRTGTPSTDANRVLRCPGGAASLARLHDLRWRVGDASAEIDPGDRVAAAKELQKLADEALRAAVIAEREAGTPWEVVGKALGTSRSGAHGRFAEDVNEWRRNHPRTSHQDAQDQLDSAWASIEDLVRQQLLLDPGRLEEAEQILRGSAAEGSAHALCELAELFMHTGRAQEAEDCLRRAAAGDAPYAVVTLAQLLLGTGRAQEAEEELRQAEVNGNLYASTALAEFLIGAGRTAEAEGVLRQAVDRGDSRAITMLARLLLDTDRSNEAERILRRASESGDRRAASALAGLSIADHPEDVDEYLLSAAMNVVHLACHGAAADLLDAGRDDAAKHVLGGAVRNDKWTVLLSACSAEANREHRLLEALFTWWACQSSPEVQLAGLIVIPTDGASPQFVDAKRLSPNWSTLWAFMRPEFDQVTELQRRLITWKVGNSGPASNELSTTPDRERILALESRLAKLEADLKAGREPRVAGKKSNDGPR